jgi:hypothetical protein
MPLQPFLDAFGVAATFTPNPIADVVQASRPVQCVVETEPRAFGRSETLSFPPEVGLEIRHVEAVFRASDVSDMARGAVVAVGGRTYRVSEILPEIGPPEFEGSVSVLLKDEG